METDGRRTEGGGAFAWRRIAVLPPPLAGTARIFYMRPIGNCRVLRSQKYIFCQMCTFFFVDEYLQKYRPLTGTISWNSLTKSTIQCIRYIASTHLSFRNFPRHRTEQNVALTRFLLVPAQLNPLPRRPPPYLASLCPPSPRQTPPSVLASLWVQSLSPPPLYYARMWILPLHLEYLIHLYFHFIHYGVWHCNTMPLLYYSVRGIW